MTTPCPVDPPALPPPTTRRPRGVTLVELLVTISLIAVMAALLMPALSIAREIARKSSCMTNLASIAKGFTAYDAAKGQLPGWRNLQDLYSSTMYTTTATKTKACVSWTVTVMPYLGEREIFRWYENYTTTEAVDTATGKRIARYVCPSLAAEQRDKNPAAVAYVGNAGTAAAVLNGALQYRGDGAIIDTVGNLSTAAWYVTQASGSATAQQYQPTRYSLETIGSADGESATALLAERTGLAVPKTITWSSNPLPTAANALAAPEAHVFLQPLGITAGQVYATDRKTGNTWMRLSGDTGLRYPSSCHGRGYQLAFCDGHTRTISDNVDPWVYSQLLSSDQSARSPRVQGWEQYKVGGTGSLVHYILDDKDVDKK